MKSDKTLPRFNCLWLWAGGEALLHKGRDDVLFLSSDRGCSSAQKSHNRAMSLIMFLANL